MQTTMNEMTSPVRSLAAGTWVALFALLALCLCTLPVMAATGPPIVVSGAPVQLGALTGGGWDGSQEPVGGTFVIGVNGNVLVGDGYSSNFLQITPSGTDTILASGVGASNAALDVYGNLYFGGNYNSNVYKVPYNAATGQYVGWTTTPTTNCMGGNQDTSPCIFAPAVSAFLGTLGGQGYAGVAFDGQGNFFFETNTLPTTTPNTIFECNLACIASSSATPTLIYSDPNPVGAFEIDPWGNIFFVDGNNSKGKATVLNELPLSAGSYATSPTVVESYTNAAGYGNGISGLAISGTGTLYISVNGDGLFAIPNTKSGGPNPGGIYQLSTQGGKGVAVDSKGNLYGIPYNGGDVVSFIPVGKAALGASPTGTAATAVSATIFDSAASCTAAPTLAVSVTEFGVPTTEFTAAAGTTCSTTFGGGNGVFASGPLTAAAFTSFPVTVNFTPIAVGERNAALTIKDAANSASGTAALTGVGQGPTGNVDPGVLTTYANGISLASSVVADPAGDRFVANGGAVLEFPAGSTTPVTVASGFVSTEGLAFDANGDLFIADDGVPDVVEIPNTGTTGAFAAGTQSTVVSPTTLFGGTALADATALAVGPGGTLYISDNANKRVVFWNPIVGQSGVTLATAANGVKAPAGLAVDSSSNLYVADSTLDQVLIFSAAGGISAITPPNVTQAVGVAVDASGSVLVADGSTGNIVRVPDLSGTLTTASAITIETIAGGAYSLWMDSQGNLYVPSASGKAAYAIQRTAAAIDLGTVSDGVTNSATVYLMSAGNTAATLATPVVTEPTNTMFTLVPAASNGCSAGSSGPPGAACQFTGTFAPPPATADGPQVGTAMINIASPAFTFNVSMSGSATVSSILPQTITGFTPPTSLQIGQQITLSATGGASGNPVVFSIDPASACPTCATIAGSVLTAVSTGAVKVDANQAGGSAGGKQYAAATQVQAAITINNTVVASDVPALLMNQIYWSYQSGAFTDGQNPAGGSFVVTPNGEVVVGTTYNNKADFISASTGALLNQVSISGPGGFTTDSHGNLYMAHLYGPSVLKIPYVNGVYATLSDTSPANCTGTDTTLCTFASVPSGGVKAIAFDPSGNFYMVTVPASPGTSAIYECALACQTGGTGTLVYSDVNSVSQIAFDPWGNMFFTEGVYTSGTNFSNLQAASSNLNELPFNGTSFAATPTLLQTLTVASPGNYDNQLDGVAVTSNGTIYYATQNEGMFAIPNTQAGGPDVAHQYVVSALGAKGMELDAQGNEWVVVYHAGGDNLGEALIGDLTTPNAQYQGAPVNAPATVVDNALGCGTAATLAIASTNTEFGATAGTTCSTISANFSTPVNASSYPATITFTATKPNSQTANLTVTDTTNGGEGTATVTGFALTTPQTLTFTAPTTTTFTYSPGETIAVKVSNGGSNNPAAFTVDSSSTGAGTFSATTVTGTSSSTMLTVTQAGSIVIDANELGGLAGGVYYDSAPQAQLTLTINKSAEVITFTPPTSPVVYSPGLTVNLNAVGSGSSSPIAFTVDASSTGMGTVVGNTLTVTQAGTIVLDANQVADVNYLAAPQVQQILVVNQATQTITFTPVTTPFYYIASCSPITLCATIQIQATGGATNNLVALSPDPNNKVIFTILNSAVDKNGVTTATLALVPNQSLSFPANLIIDGNQQGNANYAAATQRALTISVLGPLPLQSITWANPGTQVGGASLTLAATASSGFPVTYTSGTSLVCTVSGSTVTFAKVTSASACTITATQPGDNLTFAAAVPLVQTFDVNPAGQSPNLNMSLSLSSLTIQPGTVGLTQITLTSVNNFAASSVTFTLTGLPTGYTYSFNPNPVTAFAQNTANGLPLGTTVTTTLTITPPAAAVVVRQDFRPLFPATLAVALCFLGFKKRNRLYMLALLVVLFAGLGFVSGCGGTSSSATPPAVTSTATITATPAAGLAGASGSVKSSSTLTVIYE